MNLSLLEQADRALTAGRFDEAERFGREALAADPGNPSILLILGIAYVNTGRAEQALPVLQEIPDTEVASGPASLWLARVYRKLGNLGGALEAARSAVRKMPNHGHANHQLGVTYLDMRDFENAARSLEKAAAISPNAPGVQYARGLALQGLGQNSAAIQSFKRASVLAPKASEILESLFEALMDESDSAEALACARTLLSWQPDAPRAQLRMARALLANNKPDEAQVYLEQALESGPQEGNFTFATGALLQSLGRIDEATAKFRRSIELLPEQGFAYSALAYNRKTTEADRPLVDRMQRLCDEGDLPIPAKTHLHYALGKSLEDLGDYEHAMAHFDVANRLSYQMKFGERPFDRQPYAARIDANIKRSKNAMSANSVQAGEGSPNPIFVVGMLRSGTTLVDQVLSSHPEVGSVGEQGFWLHHRDEPWAKDGAMVDRTKLKHLAAEYLRRLAEVAPGSRHVVDKMPDNYLEIPLLHMAFPQAKIVHVKRNPADTCISIYTTINRLRVGWAHNKENIVFAYRQYERVMEQWRKILPAGAMFELSYEDLVTDQERVTRELVAFCGLEWNDACLYPESNRRSVVTPSAWQVRQPLYGTSIARWKRYEPWLGGFSPLVVP